MAIFKIHHITKYEYDRQIKESINEIKIFPYQCKQQEVVQHEVIITGNPAIQTFTDYWGNKSGSFKSLFLLFAENSLIIFPSSSKDPHTFDCLVRSVHSRFHLSSRFISAFRSIYFSVENSRITFLERIAFHSDRCSKLLRLDFQHFLCSHPPFFF